MRDELPSSPASSTSGATSAVSYCPTHPPHYTRTSVSICDQSKPQRPQDALTVPNFTTSDESFATEELVNAYRAGDAEAIAKLITSNSIFMNIDNQVTCFVSS